MNWTTIPQAERFFERGFKAAEEQENKIRIEDAERDLQERLARKGEESESSESSASSKSSGIVGERWGTY